MRPLSDALHRVIGLSIVAALYTFCVNGGVINGSDLADYVASLGPSYFATLWAARDAKDTKYWPAYHYGICLVVLAPILVPHYILKTRGRSGLGLVLELSACLWLGFLGWWLYYDLPDLR